MHDSARNPRTRAASRLLPALSALPLLMLCGFAPNDGSPSPSPPSTSMPLAACAAAASMYHSDEVAYETGECWDVWSRAASACTKTSVHTFVLEDPFQSFVVYATDDVDAPGATNLASSARACTQRQLTLEVQHELTSAPGVWLTIDSYTVSGTWLSSYDKCSLWTNYKYEPISVHTSRVRLTVQAVRQDGSYAGTQTFGGYSVPVGYLPCGVNP
jgi:hypothetical protein